MVGRAWWRRMQDRFGARRVTTVSILLLIGVASLAVRLLYLGGLERSAILYVAVPYLISLAIALMRSYERHPNSDGYVRHVVTAVMVFLASSVVLFEGFLCVLFFLPIYLILVSIGFLIHSFLSSNKGGSGRAYVHVLPILILASSFEGTSESLSFDRNIQVTATRVTELSTDDIMANLSRPIDLRRDRPWILSVFPMPDRIDAGSLEVGDIHTVHSRYHRWFVTNTHEGVLDLQITEVARGHVRTRILRDETFFASYLTLIGTEIVMREIENDEVEISLTVRFRRELDPAWYFQPLQSFAVTRMAGFLIEEVMIRD